MIKTRYTENRLHLYLNRMKPVPTLGAERQRPLIYHCTNALSMQVSLSRLITVIIKVTLVANKPLKRM